MSFERLIARLPRQLLSCVACLYALAIILVALPSSAQADSWDAPAGYYDAATGSSAVLKGQLATIMATGQIQRTYGDYRYSAAITDADPNHPGNILLVYNRQSAPATWDAGLTWNREHVWPQSLQPGPDVSNTIKGHKGDPFALRPGNPSINSSRSNKPYGWDTTTGTYGSQGSYWFPGDADKGDVARSLFYSATLYSSLGLTLVDTTPTGYQMGDLSSLIRWNYVDVPDEFERRRNHTIYSQAYNPSYYTNNRNAYIDHPEYVWSVFGGDDNDTQLAVSTPGGDGSSSSMVNMGRVIVGGTAPGPQNVSLQKTGADGTYYSVTTTGGATSSVTGRYNAFDYGSGSRTISVGLSASTAQAGLVSGAVAIDNLDVCGNSPPGKGSNDGNDTVNVQLAVLDHAHASFAPADSKSITINFGNIAIGSGLQSLPLSLYNLLAASGYTANLDIDAITGSGDQGALTTTIAPGQIVAGDHAAFLARLSTGAIGDFSAIWTIANSDEDLSGAIAGESLTLRLLGSVTSGLPGDANGDRKVSFADYLVLEQNFGKTDVRWSMGDFTNDGKVSFADYLILEQSFGKTIPEPATLSLLVLAALAMKRRK